MFDVRRRSSKIILQVVLLLLTIPFLLPLVQMVMGALGGIGWRNFVVVWDTGVIPTFEAHLNMPLDHRGTGAVPVGFVDQLTLLGGTHFFFYDRTSLGFAAGSPVTGPRPFSLQATVQMNVRF